VRKGGYSCGGGASKANSSAWNPSHRDVKLVISSLGEKRMVVPLWTGSVRVRDQKGKLVRVNGELGIRLVHYHYTLSIHTVII
jgi:hypothetical protein